MISPVLLKVAVGCSRFQGYRSAVVQHVEEHFVIVSDELQQARCQCGVATRENPAPLLKISSRLAIFPSEIHAPPSSRGASRKRRLTALESCLL